MSRIRLLAQRRALLTAECALQRVTLVSQTQPIAHMAGWFRTGSSLMHPLKHIPFWASALLVGLVVFVPGRAVSLAKNGLALLQIWRAFTSKTS